MKNTVFPHKFWRPFLDCMPQLFFRPQYVWFPVHLKGHLIPLCYETLVVNWQNWVFTLFHQSRSVLSPNPITWTYFEQDLRCHMSSLTNIELKKFLIFNYIENCKAIQCMRFQTLPIAAVIWVNYNTIHMSKLSLQYEITFYLNTYLKYGVA